LGECGGRQKDKKLAAHSLARSASETPSVRSGQAGATTAQERVKDKISGQDWEEVFRVDRVGGKAGGRTCVSRGFPFDGASDQIVVAGFGDFDGG
jgi:hypothetical protein